MKLQRGYRWVAREQHLPQRDEHHYHPAQSMPDPTVCPSCDATYRNGQWTWEPAPVSAHRELCPACQRMREDLPAGVLFLKSTPFLSRHLPQILEIVRATEAREMHDHPLQRIMSVEKVERDIRVNTTDAHLAREIGRALHDAYGGDLQTYYNEDDLQLRAAWKRY